MELPDTHLETLKGIASGDPDAIQIAPDVLDDLRRWGMVMPGTLELTGMGARLVGEGSAGLVGVTYRRSCDARSA